MSKENQKMHHVHRIFGNRPELTKLAESLNDDTNGITYGDILQDAVIYLDGELRKKEARNTEKRERRIIVPHFERPVK
tara:strand:+ start:940 stop:1173 length:234 start_codon:yes stop_codon:yes gene_type:complete